MSTARQRAAFQRAALALYLGQPDADDPDDADAIGQLVDDQLSPAETVDSLRGRRSPLVKPRP